MVDPGCTTAGAIAPALLRQAGCEVIEYNTKVDSSFPLGVADPTETSVVERLRKHIQLSTDVEPTVATIVNVEELRKRNPFYNKAENGDHLVVTTDRAILYDPDHDIILDVIPVQLQPAAASAAGAKTRPPLVPKK